MDYSKILNDWSNDPESQQYREDFYTALEKALVGKEFSPDEQELFKENTFKWHVGDLFWAADAMMDACGGEVTAKVLKAIIDFQSQLDLQQ